jgi:hypothetical protein
MKDYSSNKTEASVIADLIPTDIRTINGRPFATIPGQSPALILAAEEPPPFVVANVQIHTLASLLAYLKVHQAIPENASVCDGIRTIINQRELIVADKAEARIVIIFDYHRSASQPARVKNLATLRLELDGRFIRFQKKFSTWISQEDFIDLIEENEAAYRTPSSSSMLELAENLEFHHTSKVVSRKTSRNGTGEIRFESNEGEQSTKLPEYIDLGLPIYKGFVDESGKLKAWVIRCRLRYRLNKDGVLFMLVPQGLDDLLDEVWNDLIGQVSQWGPPVIEGTPS